MSRGMMDVPAEYATFDVYDTCLLRLVACPTDLFHEIGKRLAREYEPYAGDPTFASRFSIMRSTAERRAHARSPHEEVLLAEIWDELAPWLPGVSPTRGAELELLVERQSYRPNVRLLGVVRSAREAGKRIAFLSDTYFPGSFLETELSRLGFFHPGDLLYSSADRRATKRTGRLFELFLRETGVSPRRVVHHGDNPLGDAEVPARLGIRCVAVRDSNLQSQERLLAECSQRMSLSASRLVGTMRAARIAARDEHGDPGHAVAGFIAPVVTLFALWVLKCAERDGLKVLHFLARDCALIWRAAQRLAPLFGDIDCRYVLVSRQALLLPSVSAATERGLEGLRRIYPRPTLGMLVDALEMSLDQLGPEIAKRAGGRAGDYRLLNDDDWRAFWRTFDDPSVVEFVQQRIHERRRPALDYLAMMGVLGGAPSAIVDLGWALFTQRVLAELRGPGASPRGYYLGIQADHQPPHLTGPVRSLFFDPLYDRRQTTDAAEVFNRVAQIDHVLGLATHGTVLHYEGSGSDVRPVCKPIPAHRLRLGEKAAAAVDDFAGTFAAGGALDLSEDEIRLAIDQLIKEFFRNPRPEWVRPFESFSVATTAADAATLPLIRPLRLRDSLAAILRRRLGADPEETIEGSMWFEGSRTLASGRYHAVRRWKRFIMSWNSAKLA